MPQGSKPAFYITNTQPIRILRALPQEHRNAQESLSANDLFKK